MEETEIEELIPKKFYVELFRQYVDLAIESQVSYVKGLVTGVVLTGTISYLIYFIYG